VCATIIPLLIRHRCLYKFHDIANGNY